MLFHTENFADKLAIMGLIRGGQVMKQSVFSDIIRSLRKNAGYTQEEVSSKLNIQRQTYCNYENACRTPPLEIIIALAELYQVSIDYLVRGAEGGKDHSAQTLMKDKLYDSFSSLPKSAQREVLNFIRFKKSFSD